jgi:15-cis-phytoene synthase/lycopene beta-cyclase
MIVFGLAAFDNALAVLYTLTSTEKKIAQLPTPVTLVRALLKPTSEYDEARINGLRDAVQRLRNKSRSFYVASGAFEGKLRIDLILLYSFCRVADDLIDNATSPQEARDWIEKLATFLDLSYGKKETKTSKVDFVETNFPAPARSALLLLPTRFLDKQPLYDLLKGFEMDLEFLESKNEPSTPINTEEDLELYSARVAGTVAHSCLDLVFHHSPQDISPSLKAKLILAGENMGIALQLVNISRDVFVDAKLSRVYIPQTWLVENNLTVAAALKNPSGVRIDQLRQRLLQKAFGIYQASRGAIEELPEVARGPMRVAVESYMEIGRVLREGGYPTKRGKATVPKWRRVVVAWRALNGEGSKGNAH